MVYVPTKSAIEINEEQGEIIIPHLWVDAVFNLATGRPDLALGPDPNGYVGYGVPYPTQGQPIYFGPLEDFEEDDGQQLERISRNGASNRTGRIIKGYDPSIAAKVLWARNRKIRRLFATGNGNNQLIYHTALIVYENLLASTINRVWSYRFYYRLALKSAKRVSNKKPGVIDMLAVADAGLEPDGCIKQPPDVYYKDFYSDGLLNPTDDLGNPL